MLRRHAPPTFIESIWFDLFQATKSNPKITDAESRERQKLSELEEKNRN